MYHPSTQIYLIYLMDSVECALIGKNPNFPGVLEHTTRSCFIQFIRVNKTNFTIQKEMQN